MEHRKRFKPPLDQSAFLVTAEHASNRVPPRYKNLGLPARRLREHIAWDPGSQSIAQACARALGCLCHLGRYSRLLVDLNRGAHHRKLMAPETFGVAVPGNQNLSPEEKAERLHRYYEPFRKSVLTDARRILKETGRCIHLSIHSFTPEVDGVERTADIGVLYDPSSRLERRIAERLVSHLTHQGYKVRRNYPYRGTDDGHVTALRRLFGTKKYAGVEVEVNQALLENKRNTRVVANHLGEALQELWPSG